MSCQDCNNSSISLTGSWYPGSPCSENTECGGTSYNAQCVYYNGPNLPCSGVNTLDSLEYALQKIDEQICAISGDYSTYNMNCLNTWYGSTISTQAEFVDAITGYACAIATNLSTFINTTYTANQATLDDRISSLELPDITCVSASVTDADDLQTVLAKYCSKFEDIDDKLSISGITWNSCLTVVGTPTTIAQGFQLLADQICDVYDLVGAGGILPTFNNSLSCISGTSNDTLVETIELIKTRLCETPTYDFSLISWGCWGTQPASFQEFIAKTVSYLNSLNSVKYQFDNSDFTLTAVDPMNPCDGQVVSLATPLNVDRFVASNASDLSPSTLVDKLTSVGSISLDDSSNTDISIDVTDKDYGDITVTGSGNTWTIDNDAVTFAKMQNISTSTLLGRSTAGTGDVEQVSIGGNLVLSGGVLSVPGKTLIGVTKFSSSGTWTKPANCTAVLTYVVAAGGGGAGALSDAAESAVGSGGGAGGYSINYITTGLGSTETVVVGIGGDPGNLGNSWAGQPGTNSSFGSHVTAYGGLGGETLASGTSIAKADGGLGGAPSISSGTTIITSSGECGNEAIRFSASVGTFAKGGSSIFGSSYNGGVTGIGAGGYGNVEYNAVSGGAEGYEGGDGYVIVYEYS